MAKSENEKAADMLLELDEDLRPLAMYVLLLGMGLAKGYHRRYPDAKTKPVRTLLRVIVDDIIEGIKIKFDAVGWLG